MKRILIAVVAAYMVIVLSGCGNGGTAGEYVYTKTMEGAMTVDIATELDYEVVLELNKDGTAVLDTGEQREYGTWDDRRISIGDELDGIYSIKNGNLIWTVHLDGTYYMSGTNDLYFTKK